MMTSLVLLVCLVYAAQAQSQINSNLCEMEIEPGTFDNKLVLGGNYIETNSVKYTFATANDCMQGCCDQSHNPGENQPLCTVAYFYQEPDPTYQYSQRNVCLWWNCSPGDCQSSKNVDPSTTSRIGRIIQDGNANVPDANVQPASQYQNGYYGPESQPYQSGYQPIAQNADQPQYGDVQQQVPVDQNQYQPSNVQSDDQYRPDQSMTGQYPNQGAPSNQYTDQVASNGQYPNQVASNGQYPNQVAPSGQYPSQGVAEAPVGQYPAQNQAAPSNVPPPQSGTQPAQAAGTPGQWMYNQNTGQYVFVYPDGTIAQNGAASQSAANVDSQGSNNGPVGDQTGIGSNQYQPSLNASDNNATVADDITTVPPYTTTDVNDKGWGFWNWWNGDGDDDDDDDDYADEETDEEWEKEWEEEEEKEEEEWQEELAEWDDETENGTTPVYTTMSPEEIEELEEEEAEWQKEQDDEEQEMEAWLNGQDSKDNDSTAQNTMVEPTESGVPADDSQYYKPETFPPSHESSWAANAPVIAVGTCAGVVLMLLILVLLGKKLTGNTDRAQYKPLRESFSGSSTYHEDI